MVDSLQRGTTGTYGRGARRTARQDVSGNRTAQQQAATSQPELTYLDLFSTSQTKSRNKGRKNENSDKRIYDECSNNAPYFGYQIEGKRWGVVQGCCNDWNCPRCGQQRAREEYGRIVNGARIIGETQQLYMLTLTCRGRDMSLQDAEHNYLVWTNKILTRLRLSYHRSGKKWFYASVTERQKRQHPHSHYLTTYCPHDAVLVKKGEFKHSFTEGCEYVARHDTLQSSYLEQSCRECGLGWQYDLSVLRTVEGASRYVAKYLFKETIFATVWPKGWRRVRYSQNWPKLPDVKTDALLLLSQNDWYDLARRALIIKTKDDGAKKYASRMLKLTDCIIQ
jgi:hypothetical protein